MATDHALAVARDAIGAAGATDHALAVARLRDQRPRTAGVGNLRGAASRRLRSTRISSARELAEGHPGYRELKQLRQLRADDLEAEPLRHGDCGLRVVLLLRWLDQICGRDAAFLEHALKAAGRDDNQRTRALRLDLKRVRHASLPPNPGAGAGDELVVSSSKADLALKDIERFVFLRPRSRPKYLGRARACWLSGLTGRRLPSLLERSPLPIRRASAIVDW
jgi:hypothetical protein